MKPNKKNHSKHAPAAAKAERTEIERKMLFLEQEVQRLTRANQIYLQQIREQQADNMGLCQRLDAALREREQKGRFEEEMKRGWLHREQLTRIVHLLEEQLRVKEGERAQVVAINERMAERIKQLQCSLDNALSLREEAERYKIKLLQSEKYWLTRSETLLASRQAEKEKSLFELQQNYECKLRAAHDEVRLKQKAILQKEEQIHKLIAFIQQKLQ